MFTIPFRALSTPILLGQKHNVIIPVLIWDLWEGGQYSELAAMGVMLSLFMGVISVAFFKFGSVFGGIDCYSAG